MSGGVLFQVPDVFIPVQIADDEWGVGPKVGDGYPCVAKCSNEECAKDVAHFLNVSCNSVKGALNGDVEFLE